MLDTSIQVKTDHFDGPLGLLLLLVQKEEMNVRELDLTKITKQYLDYLSEMKDLNFDIAGDYLFLASTLLLIKSKNCVTDEESARLKDSTGSAGIEITTHAELVRRLEELQHFQKMGEKLWALDKRDHEIFTKPKINRKTIINSILTPIDLNELTSVMMDFLFREKRKYTVVRRDRLSIKEKLQFMKSHLEVGKKTEFADLLQKDGAEKGEVENTVITFISLLELARLQRVTVFQNEDKSNIYVECVKSLSDFNPEQANGFEDEDEVAEKESDEMLQKTIDDSMNALEAAAEKEVLAETEEVKESTHTINTPTDEVPEVLH